MFHLSNKDFFWYWITNINGLGTKGITSLLEKYGSPEAIYYADEKEVLLEIPRVRSDVFLKSKNEQDIMNSLLALYQDGFRFIHWESDDYPERLRNIYDVPYGIYLKGKLPDPNKPSLAMVGSRKATDYGIEIAKRFSAELAKEGVQIISGLAEGIDSAAHRGALSVDGYTMGVLGGGINTTYPLSNYNLYQMMYEKGGVISEYNRGVRVNPGMFPVRNRIISGMCDGVFVLEAAYRSGSFITADRALEQGREVFALPGRITDKMSEGCNNLIAIGATIVRKTEDILEVLYDNVHYHCSHDRRSTGAKEDTFSDIEKQIMAVLDEKNVMGFDEIQRAAQLSTDDLIEHLFLLEMNGHIRQIQQNQYVKNIKL